MPKKLPILPRPAYQYVVDRVMDEFKENQTLSRTDKEFVRSMDRLLERVNMKDLKRFMRILGIPSDDLRRWDMAIIIQRVGESGAYDGLFDHFHIGKDCLRGLRMFARDLEEQRRL